MKTRKLLIAILAVALLVVYYLMGTDYLKQRKEHGALASQIADSTRLLAQIPPTPADLESRLTAAQTDLDAVNNSFPGKLNSTRIVNTILQLADDVGIKAVPLITQPWTTEDVNDYSYLVFRLNVAVTGTFTQLVNFLSQLENGELETLTIEYLTVDRITESSGKNNHPEGAIPVNANLDIAIYSRPPADN